MHHFKFAQLGLAAAALFAASVASAAPVTTWDYTVDSWFSNGGNPGAPAANSSGGGVGQTAGDGTTLFLPSRTSGAAAAANAGSSWSISATELSWGRTGGSLDNGTRSGLTISDVPKVGTVDTGGPFVAANTYTHSNGNNLGIDSWTLNKTRIDSVLTLTADGIDQVFRASYSVDFVETPNRAAGCPTADTDAVLCSDIFVIFGSLGEPFSYNGYDYTFVFNSPDFNLNDDQCILAGKAAGCLGFSTAEGAATPVQFEFALIATQQVPEPASIALLGLGLLGLAGVRARKQKNKA